MTQAISIKNNSLNELSGKEWIKHTKSWFNLRAAQRDEKILHPACFPEKLVERFLEFFTKTNDWIIDPFAGSGTSLVIAKKLKRYSFGIELYEKYVNLTKNRLNNISSEGGIQSIITKGDSRNILDIVSEYNIPNFDFCITSPPYWDQLNNNSERHADREEMGLDSKYGEDFLDLGMIHDYKTFLTQQKFIFEDLYEIMKNRSYLVIVTNNVYKNGRLWPLAFDTLKTLSEKWVPKDEIIWCQDDRQLRPFGMFHSYIGNRSHHYCLIFRKEDN